MASFRFQYLFIFLLLNFFEIVQQVYSIKGPTHIRCSIGEDASFMWNTTDQKEIFSASWGIRKGNIPYPQFISVNGYNGKVHLNEDIDAALKKRVEFIGNLTIGRAWFVLKNLTVDDTNDYIASISDDASTVLPYPVRVMVAEKDKDVFDLRLISFPNLFCDRTELVLRCSVVVLSYIVLYGRHDL